MKTSKSPDMSVQAVFRTSGWIPRTPEEMLAEMFDIDFEVAVTSGETSAKWITSYTYLDFTEDDYIVTGSYSDVISGIADELFSENASRQRLLLNTVVERIDQDSDGLVKVYTTDGRLYEAERVIITVSLGVLHHRHVSFKPELPDWKLNSIFAFNFVTYLQVYMQFPTVFWDDNEYMLHANTRRGYFPFWQNFNKFWPGSRILQVTVVHTEAIRLMQLTDAEIQNEAMQLLRQIYNDAIPEPTGIVVPRWSNDPLFMGMYSDWPPGFSGDSHQGLAAAVDRVHFAGEHTNQRYFGYLHGAYFSGIRAAEEVTDCLEGRTCTQYRPPYQARGCTYQGAENYDDKALLDDGSCKIRPPTSTAVAIRVNTFLAVTIWLNLFI